MYISWPEAKFLNRFHNCGRCQPVERLSRQSALGTSLQVICLGQTCSACLNHLKTSVETLGVEMQGLNRMPSSMVRGYKLSVLFGFRMESEGSRKPNKCSRWCALLSRPQTDHGDISQQTIFLCLLLLWQCRTWLPTSANHTGEIPAQLHKNAAQFRVWNVD